MKLKVTQAFRRISGVKQITNKLSSATYQKRCNDKRTYPPYQAARSTGFQKLAQD